MDDLLVLRSKQFMIAWSGSFINSGPSAGLPRRVHREHLASITSTGHAQRI